MKIYGDMEMQENELQNVVVQTVTGIPSTTRAGTIAFYDKKMYIAAEISNGDPIWVPLTQDNDYHVHTQGASSLTWTINHDLKSTAVTVYVYDDATESIVIPNSIAITDANTVTVTFTSAISGRAVVMYGLFDNADVVSGNERFVLTTDSTNGSTTFTDQTGTFSITNNGSTAHSTTESKFGATSAFFNGSTNVLAGSSNATGHGTGDFTMEAWINTSVSTLDVEDRRILMTDTVGNATTNPELVLDPGTGSAKAIASTAINLTGSVPVDDGEWHHVALVRVDGVVTLFIDGFNQGSQSYTANVSILRPQIGAFSASTGMFNGYIDSVRIESGYGRYTRPFKLPTIAFPV